MLTGCINHLHTAMAYNYQRRHLPVRQARQLERIRYWAWIVTALLITVGVVLTARFYF